MNYSSFKHSVTDDQSSFDSAQDDVVVTKSSFDSAQDDIVVAKSSFNSTQDDRIGRRYDIDWLRIMLIFSVFLFHIGMYFNSFGWHIKNPERLTFLDPFMGYLHTWRMSLLFFVSGVGTYFALGKRTIGQFFGERSRKLLIPLVFGMFVIVPPQIFVEKQAQYGTFLNFIPHIAEGSYPQGNFSWHHLWFILYLFICASAAIPVILLLRSSAGKRFYRMLEKYANVKGFLLLLAIPLFLGKMLLLPYFPHETHALVDDWEYILSSFLFFLYGYILLSNAKLTASIIQQRRIFAVIALLLSLLYFYDWFHSIDPYVSDNLQLLLYCMLQLSIALALIGYFGRYLNSDHPWRKKLNEAIYPFYILHQTVILVLAFSLREYEMQVGWRVLILTVLSFATITAIYIFLVRPFKITRFLFGMARNEGAKRRREVSVERERRGEGVRERGSERARSEEKERGERRA
jgi:peptidoglycan/LPS O-acetylase OafA/YrhL